MAIAAYQKAENLKGELRSKLILANFHEMLGDKVEAVGIANEVLIPAKAFGFMDLVTQAEDHVRGVPFYRRAEAEMRRREEEDPDFRSVDDDDEMLMRSVKAHGEDIRLAAFRLASRRAGVQVVEADRSGKTEPLSLYRPRPDASFPSQRQGIL